VIPYQNFLTIKVRYGDHDKSMKILHRVKNFSVKNIAGRNFLVFETEGEWTAIPVDVVRKIEATVPVGGGEDA